MQALRLKGLGSPLTWQLSGFLSVRGTLATWQWTRGYWVLLDGVLYNFSDNSLAAKATAYLPALGARVAKAPPTSTSHPHVLSITLHRRARGRPNRFAATPRRSHPLGICSLGFYPGA